MSPTGRLLLVLALVLGGTLRGLRLGEPPGGYLAFNETFYIDEALREARRAPWDWLIHPLLYDKPPLYVGIVQVLYRAHLPEVAAARFVSVAAGLATICLVFLLARLLFDERTAVTSAAVLAVMPGVVLVDHNAQVDPLMVALIMASLVLYVLALRTQRMLHALAAGTVLGVALLTKQPAVLVLVAVAAWDVWRVGPWELLSRRFIAFAGATVGVGASWYVLELLIAPHELIGGMSATGGRATPSSLSPSFWSFNLGSELLWMLFPAAAVLAVLGVAYILAQRRTGDKLVLVCLAFFLIYYVLFHLHSYYLLPTAPFFALAIGRVLMGGGGQRVALSARWVTTAGLVSAMALGSVLMLSGQKWGYWSPMAGVAAGNTSYVVDSNVAAFFGPAFNPGGDAAVPAVLTLEQYLALPRDDSRDFVAFHIYARNGSDPAPKQVFSDTLVLPVVFGYAIAQERWSDFTGSQRFTNSRWEAEKVGPVWDFGVFTLPWRGEVARYDRAALLKANSGP